MTAILQQRAAPRTHLGHVEVPIGEVPLGRRELDLPRDADVAGVDGGGAEVSAPLPLGAPFSQGRRFS